MIAESGHVNFTAGATISTAIAARLRTILRAVRYANIDVRKRRLVAVTLCKTPLYLMYIVGAGAGIARSKWGLLKDETAASAAM